MTICLLPFLSYYSTPTPTICNPIRELKSIDCRVFHSLLPSPSLPSFPDWILVFVTAITPYFYQLLGVFPPLLYSPRKVLTLLQPKSTHSASALGLNTPGAKNLTTVTGLTLNVWPWIPKGPQHSPSILIISIFPLSLFHDPQKLFFILMTHLKTLTFFIIYHCQWWFWFLFQWENNEHRIPSSLQHQIVQPLGICTLILCPCSFSQRRASSAFAPETVPSLCPQ